MQTTTYEDLYDIEARPGAGVTLWTKAVRMQLQRVQQASYRHRLNHSLNEDEQRDDENAEWQLHSDVYFLALAVRRVRLFHDLVVKHVQDQRLDDARKAFDEAAPTAKSLRDFYEHLDEYLIDSPTKHRKFPGRASPLLHCTWRADNVTVSFGPERLDITLAAKAAVRLGEATAEVWREHRDRVRPKSVTAQTDPRECDRQVMEVTTGVSTLIGSEDDPPEVATGVLLDVRVREATAEELASRKARE